jgi:hypothetical protein
LSRNILILQAAKKVIHHHSTPLSLDLIPTSDYCSVDEAAAEQLSGEYNINYASCIGSLIYLAMTRTDINHAVNKLAKFSRHPGKTILRLYFMS